MEIERKEETQGWKKYHQDYHLHMDRKQSYIAINILALESRKIIEFQTKRKSLDTKLFMKEKERMLGGIYKFIQFL